MSDYTPSLRHAAQRCEVRLPDGTTGTLLYISKFSKVAKIRQNNHHRLLPVSMLKVMATHLAPMPDSQVFPCCGRTLERVGVEDRVTADASRVTCHGWRQ